MPDGDSPFTKEELKEALKAFRKRLRLANLDEESKLSTGPFSGGKSGGIVAVRPPDRFPPGIWDELTRQGRMKKADFGLYELVE